MARSPPTPVEMILVRVRAAMDARDATNLKDEFFLELVKKHVAKLSVKEIVEVIFAAAQLWPAMISEQNTGSMIARLMARSSRRPQTPVERILVRVRAAMDARDATNLKDEFFLELVKKHVAKLSVKEIVEVIFAAAQLWPAMISEEITGSMIARLKAFDIIDMIDLMKAYMKLKDTQREHSVDDAEDERHALFAKAQDALLELNKIEFTKKWAEAVTRHIESDATILKKKDMLFVLRAASEFEMRDVITPNFHNAVDMHAKHTVDMHAKKEEKDEEEKNKKKEKLDPWDVVRIIDSAAFLNVPELITENFILAYVNHLNDESYDYRQFGMIFWAVKQQSMAAKRVELLNESFLTAFKKLVNRRDICNTTVCLVLLAAAVVKKRELVFDEIVGYIRKPANQETFDFKIVGAIFDAAINLNWQALISDTFMSRVDRLFDDFTKSSNRAHAGVAASQIARAAEFFCEARFIPSSFAVVVKALVQSGQLRGRYGFLVFGNIAQVAVEKVLCHHINDYFVTAFACFLESNVAQVADFLKNENDVRLGIGWIASAAAKFRKDELISPNFVSAVHALVAQDKLDLCAAGQIAHAATKLNLRELISGDFSQTVQRRLKGFSAGDTSSSADQAEQSANVRYASSVSAAVGSIASAAVKFRELDLNAGPFKHSIQKLSRIGKLGWIAIGKIAHAAHSIDSSTLISESYKRAVDEKCKRFLAFGFGQSNEGGEDDVTIESVRKALAMIADAAGKLRIADLLSDNYEKAVAALLRENHLEIIDVSMIVRGSAKVKKRALISIVMPEIEYHAKNNTLNSDSIRDIAIAAAIARFEITKPVMQAIARYVENGGMFENDFERINKYLSDTRDPTGTVKYLKKLFMARAPRDAVHRNQSIRGDSMEAQLATSVTELRAQTGNTSQSQRRQDFGSLQDLKLLRINKCVLKTKQAIKAARDLQLRIRDLAFKAKGVEFDDSGAFFLGTPEQYEVFRNLLEASEGTEFKLSPFWFFTPAQYEDVIRRVVGDIRSKTIGNHKPSVKDETEMFQNHVRAVVNGFPSSRT
eukprot:TRINITY_DN23356_c0_g3_i1.p1 TRINITY_DN23356_c0_g3~~TRINITY_DN23356_c0_g3_i1.p1  ORF type:complete len:1049 (+),score=168.52 TRINITY_DN23356_c0_g3_i1:60-3206(+)